MRKTKVRLKARALQRERKREAAAEREERAADEESRKTGVFTSTTQGEQ